MDGLLFPSIVRDVVILPDHSWLEYASWISQIIVAVLAVIAAGVACFQLREMGEYRKQRLRIANATLLLELDHRFESEEMREARKFFIRMREEIGKSISDKHPLSNEQDKMTKMCEAWTATLAQMRTEKPKEYSQLLLIGGFFETVGMMVKREYVSAADTIGLFKDPIIAFGLNFSVHIAERQKEMGVPDGLFEHALYLYGLAVEAEQKGKRP